MQNKFLWHDAKVEKPTTSDPVIGLTSNGYIVIVQYKNEKHFGKWYELAKDETYDNVVWWTDYSLPKTWKISDDYYEADT